MSAEAASPPLWRRLAAEAIGTGILVFGGCGAVVTDTVNDGALGVVGVGLAFFLVILALIAALGHLSGAHFNPGVSLSFFLTRHLPGRDLVTYVAAQMAGAVAGALLLLVVWPDAPGALGATVPSIATGRALIVEILITAILMFIVMSVATDTRAAGTPAALVVASVVGMAAIAFGPVTGASMNLARSFGPALVAGEWTDFWIYVVGPFIGAPLGALAYQMIRGEHPQVPRLTTHDEEDDDGDGAVRMPA